MESNIINLDQESSLSFSSSSSSFSSSSLSMPPCFGDHDDHREVDDQRLRFVGTRREGARGMKWNDGHMAHQEEQFDRIGSSAGSGPPTIGFFLGDDQKGGMHWEEVEERFNRVSFCTDQGSTPTIDASHFGYCIGMQQTPEFAGELLNALRGRRNHDIKLNKMELHGHFRRLTGPCYDSKIQIFFDMCDKDMDGRITKEDFMELILLSASTNKLDMKQEEAEHFASLLMQEADTQRKGYIELYQLKELFKDLTISTISSTSSPYIHEQHQNNHNHQQEKQHRIMSLVELLFRKNWRRAWVIMLWLVACIGLFGWKYTQYKQKVAFQVMGYCLCTAKGAAETLKLNMALVLLPVCRNSVTWLRRNQRISAVVPFNDSINFHKLIAGGIVIGVIIHGGAHLGCDFPRITRSNPSIFHRTFGTTFGNQKPTYLQVLGTTEAVTGFAMVILMVIVFSLATRMSGRGSWSRTLSGPVRRVMGYNAFWYSHHLLVIVYVLLIIHSKFVFLNTNFIEKTTWMYLVVPVLLYSGERIYRSIRSEIYEVDVLQAKMYPGKVLHLRLSKPAKFTHKSGMYIYIKCPKISLFEWHPFSLTSGPNDDHLSIHIKSLGDWSDRIHNLFLEAMCSKQFDYPKVYIDGPYGAASQDYVKYDVVVLIGLGIGATPFISVLKDIRDRFQKPSSNHVIDVENVVSEHPLKAYFYWVTREHGSFSWFKDVMEETSNTKHKEKVMEMCNFLTSVYKKGDARSILLSVIQALCFAKSGIDVFSQTRVQTHFSRPTWLEIFSNLASRHAGSRIGVFYCGSSNLARELEGLCTKFSTKTTTRFVFHKENYY